MSQLIIRRTAIIGGAAAVALTGWLVGRSAGVSAADAELKPSASNVAVDCEPSQQALVRQIEIDGETRTVVQCVRATTETAFARETSPLGTPSLTPAVYRPQSQPVRAVSSPAPVAQRTVAERPETATRSWQKRAMVIGGSAGAGAGIGALIGGKKGALIGAAIGGGSGTLYEVVKH